MPNYRIEYASSKRAKCKGPKPCTGTTIAKGTLRFGSITETQGRASFDWWHWGCTTPDMISNIKETCSSIEDVDGYDELNDEDRIKVGKAWNDGMVADGDIPDTARNACGEEENEVEDEISRDEDKKKDSSPVDTSVAGSEKELKSRAELTVENKNEEGRLNQVVSENAETLAEDAEDVDSKPKKKRVRAKKKKAIALAPDLGLGINEGDDTEMCGDERPQGPDDAQQKEKSSENRTDTGISVTPEVEMFRKVQPETKAKATVTKNVKEIVVKKSRAKESDENATDVENVRVDPAEKPLIKKSSHLEVKKQTEPEVDNMDVGEQSKKEGGEKPTCPAILASGSCSSPDCTLNHQVFHCDLCEIRCGTQIDFDQHLGGKRHRKNLNGTASIVTQVQCSICDVAVMGPFSTHENGKPHQRQLAKLRDMDAQPPTNASTPPPDLVHCKLCDQDVGNRKWFSHVQHPTHVRQEMLATHSALLWDSEQDKCGVQIEEEVLDFGLIKIDSLCDEPTTARTFHIILTAQASIDLVEADMTSNLAILEVDIPKFFRTHFRDVERLEFGMKYSLNIEFTPLQGDRRRYEDRVELVFEDVALRQRFIITRPVLAIVGHENDIDLLRPITRHAYPSRTAVPVAGISAVDTNMMEPACPDPVIPQFVHDALEDGVVDEKIARVRRTLLPHSHNSETYRHYWKILLWINEVHEIRDLNQYNITGSIQGHSVGGDILYTLNIPGLGESRPSVIVGDMVKVKKNGIEEGWLSGHVHHVSKEQVHLRFDQELSKDLDSIYEIQFRLNRLYYSGMHMALESSFYHPRVLFPEASYLGSVQRPTQDQMDDVSLFNSTMGENEPQMMAVTAVLKAPPGSVPFIIFGPPGTGKTVTVVEAIRQLAEKNPSIRILACTPHESTTDVLCERLIPLGSSRLFRLNDKTRPKSTFPPALKDFCLEEEEEFATPSIEALMKLQVVVSTCMSAGLLSGLGVPKGYFTHIFIDNAGQASEPESMVPIKTLGGLETNFILSGDPKQLAPDIRSPVASKLGLGASFLDRLMSLPIYNDQFYSGVTIVKLAANFRSHPEIMKFSNKEFYREQVPFCGSSTIINSSLKWGGLPRKGYPIIFHSIEGKDEPHGSSPSFINTDESSMVRKYVQDLRSDVTLRMTDNHIGIISPYNAQRVKIRGMLRAQNPTIKVGSVEDFQGQERRAIIVSTVRSSIDMIQHDLDHGVGLLTHPRRFNVAISQAQALLIIIGNPNILGLDPLWRTFLNHVHKRGGWKGRPISWDPNEEANTFGVLGSDQITNPNSVKRNQAEMEIDELSERARLMVLGAVAGDKGKTVVSNASQ